MQVAKCTGVFRTLKNIYNVNFYVLWKYLIAFIRSLSLQKGSFIDILHFILCAKFYRYSSLIRL